MRIRAIAASVLAVLTLAMIALPEAALAADCRSRINLNATAAGVLVAASGHAEVRSKNLGTRQTLTVAVDVAVVDGTILSVFTNGNLAGSITIVKGIGTLDLSNANGAPIPGGVVSVCDIAQVWVTDAAGATLLIGSF